MTRKSELSEVVLRAADRCDDEDFAHGKIGDSEATLLREAAALLRLVALGSAEPVRAACFCWQDKRGYWYADEKHPMHLGVNLHDINGPWQLPYNHHPDARGADAGDAARYRWLRERINWREEERHGLNTVDRFRQWSHNDYRIERPKKEHIDEYIDAAIKAGGGT